MWLQWKKGSLPNDYREFPVQFRETLIYPASFLPTNDATTIGECLETTEPTISLEGCKATLGSFCH
jgi:hypothetical protein